MKVTLILLISLALIDCAPPILAQVGRLRHPFEKTVDPTADAISAFQVTGEIRAVSYPREQTVKQLKLLLAPAGITVEEEQFEDWRRFKNKFSVIVEWDARPGAPDVTEPDGNSPLSNVMTVKWGKRYEGSLQSLPALTLSQNDLFVAAVDAEAKLRWWQLCPNPLTMYFDYPDPETGRLRGGMLQRSRTSLMIAFPADQKIIELKFFTHKWTAKGYVFEPLATVPVNEDAMPIQ